jgi:hypothetical protein
MESASGNIYVVGADIPNVRGSPPSGAISGRWTAVPATEFLVKQNILG